MNDFEPLDPELADLLRDDRADFERGGAAAPDAAKNAVLARVALSIAGLAALPDAHADVTAGTEAATTGGATATATAGAGAGATSVLSPLAQRLVIGIASLAVGVGTGAVGMHAYDTAVPAQGPTTVTTVTTTAIAPVPTVLASSEVAPLVASAPVEVVAPTPLVVASAPPVPAAPATVRSPDADLSAERLLLDVARAALLRGESAKALPTLFEHARRYPSGRLAEERDALAIQALARSGRVPEAQERAVRFERQYPGSLLGSAVRDALATISDK